jgi:hypothetical protein
MNISLTFTIFVGNDLHSRVSGQIEVPTPLVVGDVVSLLFPPTKGAVPKGFNASLGVQSRLFVLGERPQTIVELESIEADDAPSADKIAEFFDTRWDFMVIREG